MAFTIRTRESDGTTTLYPIDFDIGYLRREHVYVYQGEPDQYQNQLSYVWVNDSQIELDTPVPQGQEFHIRRVVPRDDIINNYTDGAVLRELNLDDSFKQAVMILQEVEDGFVSPDEFRVVTKLDMGGNRLTNVGNAVEEQDAIPLVQAQGLLAGAPQVPTDSVATFHTDATILEDDLQTFYYSAIPGLGEFNKSTIYINGVRQDQGKAYIRYEDRIWFTEPLDGDENITLITGVDPMQAPVYTTKTRTGAIAEAGQTDFLAPKYVAGQYELSVYVNGVYQHLLQGAYTEDTNGAGSNSYIYFTEGLQAGDAVEINRIQ